MTIGESISTCFRKYADFTGRASRPEFWWFALAVWLLQLVLLTIAIPSVRNARPGDGLPGVFFFMMVTGLVLVVPYLTAAVRRLHDTNRSGAMLFLNLIPLVGGVIVLVLLASEGTPGANAYGPPPGSAGSASPPPPV